MIGIDIVKIKRIENIFKSKNKKEVFLNKVLNKNEREFILKKSNIKAQAQSVAGYWAIKEALSKALGVGIGEHFSLLDCKIKKDRLNKPYIKVSKKIKEKFKLKNKHINISITHDGGIAIGVVIIIKK